MATETVENWWTEPLFTEITGQEGPLEPLERVERRVRYYLSNYVAEFTCHYYPANRSAECGDGRGGGWGTGKQRAFHDDIDTKADLDRALRRISRQQRRAVYLCIVGGCSEREAGRLMRVGRPRVNRFLQAGVENIAKILAG